MLKHRNKFRKLLLAHRVQTALLAYNSRKEYAELVIKEKARVLEIRKKQEEERKKREEEERKQREEEEKRAKEEQKKREEQERLEAEERKKQEAAAAKYVYCIALIPTLYRAQEASKPIPIVPARSMATSDSSSASSPPPTYQTFAEQPSVFNTVPARPPPKRPVKETPQSPQSPGIEI